MLKGAFILSIAAIVTKVLGFLFKIPLQSLDSVAAGYFSKAYEIYTPIYVIATAGLPLAVSKLVSQSIALGSFRDIKVIHKVAVKVLFVTGAVGSVIMFAMAFIYPQIAEQPIKFTMMIMAPAVLFCSMEGAYRGVYEGSQNMVPTAISQVIETVFKLIIGITLAYVFYNYGINQFRAGQPVYGEMMATIEDAQARCCIYAAAGTMIGVTLGAFFAIVYLFLRYNIVGDGISQKSLADSPQATSSKRIFKQLITFAIPVILGTLATQITSLIDSIFLSSTLAGVVEKNEALIREIYAVPLAMSPKNDLIGFLNGARAGALDIVNLIPNITLTLGISVFPALSRAWTEKSSADVSKYVNMVLRITTFIALPVSLACLILPESILGLLYGFGNPVTYSAAPQLRILGAAILFICLSAPTNSMLQAMGRADIPAKTVVVGGVLKLVLNIALVSIPSLNIVGAAYSTLVSQIAMVIISLVSLVRVSRVKVNLKSLFVGPLLCSIFGVGAAFGAVTIGNAVLHGPGRFTVIVAVLIAVLVYVFFLFFLRVINKNDILMFPKGEKIAQTLEKRGWIG